MADPYEGLSADQARKMLAEVRAQIPAMRQEAAALNAELASGKRSIKEIEAAGRRGARIGAGASRATTPAVESAAMDSLAAKTKRQIALENQLAAARERAAAAQALVDDRRGQPVRRYATGVYTQGEWTMQRHPEGGWFGYNPDDARTVPTRTLKETKANVAFAVAEDERKALDLAKQEVAALEQELALLNQQQAARAANLAIQHQQVQAAIALRNAAMVPPGAPPQLPPTFQGPTRRTPLPVLYEPGFFQRGYRPPPQIGGPFTPRPPQRLLPSGAPYGLLPSGAGPVTDPRRMLPATAQTATAQATEKIASAEQKASAATAGFSSNLQRNQAILAATSRDMRKFGTLTTEFIAAAARGGVTLREMGYQVSSTIGKFGGWLAAGSAIYGAFAAVQALGKGAIDAQSGVSQLQRVVNNVDAGNAIQQFRDLAGHYNLPIEDVSNAAFEMGKVFNDQNDSLEATKAVLASIKVGELDVATSSRYLTAIVQAFNLDAKDMAGVFDQVNQAQNRFGIRIQDTLAGLAKASGTFKAAGGDISTLLALITTARRATGQTGEVIGTAIARSPNFLSKEQNQAALRSFGINPDEGIDQIYEDAFNKARDLGGKKVQELAAAVGGPQYGARIFTPLLQQGDLYNKVLADTSPEASKGSAERELQSVLNQTNEQLRKVVNQVQSLGAGLAEAGAFDAFGALLKLLNGTLTLANSLVSVFNQLPDPIRKMVTYMGQFAALVAVARRFNVGESLPGAAGTLFTRRNQTAFRYREGLMSQRDFLAAEAETTSMAATRRTLEHEAAQAALQQERAAAARLGLTETEGIIAAEQRVVATKEAELAAMTKRDVIIKESLAVESQLSQVSRRTTNTQAMRLAAAHGVVIPTVIGPSMTAAGRLSATPLGASQAAMMQGVGMTGAMLPSTGLGKAGPGLFDPNAAGKRFTLLRTNVARLGTFGGVVATANTQITTAAQRAAAQMRSLDRARIGAGLSRFAGGLRGVAASIGGFIGPLDLILIGGFILMNEMSEAAAKMEEIRGQAEAASNAKSGREFERSAAQTRQSIIDIGESSTRSRIGQTMDQVREQGRILDELDAQDAARTNQLLSLIRNERTDESSELYEDDYKKQLSLIVGAYDDSNKGAIELAKRARTLIQNVRDAENLTDKQQADLIADIRTTLVTNLQGGASTAQLAAAATDEGYNDQIKEYAEAVSSGIGSLAQRRQLFRMSLIRAATLINRANNPADVAQAAEALDELTKALDTNAQAELDFSLAFAEGQTDRNRAYTDYLQATDPSRIRDKTRGLIQDSRKELSAEKQRGEALRKQLESYREMFEDYGQASEEGAFGFLGEIMGGVREDALGNLRQKIDAASKNEKAIRNRIKGLRDAQDEAIKRLRLLRREQRDARFEENQELLQARGDLAEGRADEGLPALRVALSTINRVLANAIKRYGRDSKEVLDLLGQQRDAREAIIDEQLSLIQAQAEYSAAGFSGDDQATAKAQAEIDGLERQLAFMQAHPEVYSAADILGIQAQIREAKAELAETAQQEAEDLRNALYDIQAARANARGNEVAAARAELAKALYALRTADTPLERREARADVINQRAALRQSIFDREVEDIEYQADIGRLTLQEQIRAYQGLLKTLELNRDQRRDLKRRIEQLKNEAQQDAATFDLDLGNIRLPTVYEIRRAIQGGISNGPSNVNMTQNNTFNVTGSNADEIVGKVAQKQSEAARRSMSMSRSAGLRG